MLRIIITLFLVFYSVFAFAVLDTNPVYKTILNNGLTLIYKKNSASKMVIADMFIKGGVLYEDEDKAGITNLIQRLLLKGTINRSAEDISKEIEFLGGSISADVLNDFVEVSLVVPGRYFMEGLRIFADVIKNPSFPEEEIEKEKKIIIAQLKAKDDDIFTYTHDIFADALYNTFPYHRPLIGYEETVQSIKKENLIEYHRNLYIPNHMVLVVTGSDIISEKEVLRAIDKEFGGILPSSRFGKLRENLQSYCETKTISKESSFQQGYLILGYLAPEVSSSDYPVMKLFNTILGGGGSSRIFVNLREKMGLAYELGSFYPSRRHPSEFVVYMGLDPVNIEKAKENIIKEIVELPSSVSEEDLRDAKHSLIGKFILEHSSLKKQAWYLGWFETLGMGYNYDEEYPSKIANLTLNDIKEVVPKYLKENNWICVEVLPAK